MPFVVSLAPVTPPHDTGQPPQPTRPPRVVADPGRWTAVWIAPDGTLHNLTSDTGQAFTLDAVAGLGASTSTLVVEPRVRGGARVRHQQRQPTGIDWPMRVRADTHLELVHAWRDLVRAFTQTRRLGPGRLQITRPDGSTREIQAYYDRGMEGTPGQGWLWETALISLFCPDGAWRAVAPAPPIEAVFDTGPVNFFSPFLALGASQVVGPPTTVFVDGDLEAWPVWEITGPATQLIATNHTTGETFRLSYNLGAGQKITVTSDPPTVRGPAGEVLTSALGWPDQATIWALEPADNLVSFEFTASGPGAKVRLTYTPRFETA